MIERFLDEAYSLNGKSDDGPSNKKYLKACTVAIGNTPRVYSSGLLLLCRLIFRRGFGAFSPRLDAIAKPNGKFVPSVFVHALFERLSTNSARFFHRWLDPLDCYP